MPGPYNPMGHRTRSSGQGRVSENGSAVIW